MTTPNYVGRNPGIRVAGIQGIGGYSRNQPFLTAEEMQGSPANEYHGNRGEATTPYPWEAYQGAQGPAKGPFGIENELLGDDSDIFGLSAGQIFDDPEGDYTPNYGSHAAPFPKGLMQGDMSSVQPVGTRLIVQQSAELHSANTNASKARQYSESLLANNDSWEGFYNPVQGEDLVTNAPAQTAVASAGWGVNDHTSNPLAKENEFDLNTSHRHRRYATGHIPYNYMWMQPGGRPMIKTLPHGAILPTGENSPFTGDNVMEPYSIDGAILQSPATEYSPPPQPYVTPTSQQVSDVPELAFW